MAETLDKYSASHDDQYEECEVDSSSRHVNGPAMTTI